MCKENININSIICKHINSENGILSLEGVTDTLYGEEREQSVFVEEFNIINCINIIQPPHDEELNLNYECSVRISSSSGKTVEIAQFSIGNFINKYKKSEGICRDFGVCKILTPMRDFKFLDGVGGYVLKVYIREENEETENTFEIQSMDYFTVNISEG